MMLLVVVLVLTYWVVASIPKLEVPSDNHEEPRGLPAVQLEMVRTT